VQWNRIRVPKWQQRIEIESGSFHKRDRDWVILSPKMEVSRNNNEKFSHEKEKLVLFGRMEVSGCEFFPPRASDSFTSPLPYFT